MRRDHATAGFRLLTAAMAALTLAGAKQATASPESSNHRARSPGRVDLAGVNTIRGARSGSIPVRIPAGASITMSDKLRRRAGPNRDVTIKGRGRFVGIVLVPDPYTPETNSSHGHPLVIGRFAECKRRACMSSRIINYVGPGLDRTGSLEPGDYRLHLVTDGAPAEVRLRLSGLKGRATLVPRGPVAVDLKTPPEALVSDGESVWSAGTDYVAGNVGFSLTALWAKVGRLTNFSTGLCQFHYPNPPPEAAYGPHCSALDQALGSGFMLINGDFDDDEFILQAWFGYHDQGFQVPRLDDRFGLGVWFLSPSEVIERIGSTTLFFQTAESWSS